MLRWRSLYHSDNKQQKIGITSIGAVLVIFPLIFTWHKLEMQGIINAVSAYQRRQSHCKYHEEMLFGKPNLGFAKSGCYSFIDKVKWPLNPAHAMVTGGWYSQNSGGGKLGIYYLQYRTGEWRVVKFKARLMM